MAGRRVRIKGIANLPIRRKNDTQPEITEKTSEEPIITEKPPEIVHENPTPVEKVTETSKNEVNVQKTVHFESETWGSVNRARIRPVPRFVRRGSASASESEDDTRRTRVRTESINEIRENQSVPPEKKQCRRLATARREFQMKFGVEKPPDRKKLTMMDLIFYNPVTNPMSAKAEEELIDEPTINEDIEEIQEEMAVPQVKVGPDGEIILDEQSLVVERTGERAALEKLRNSRIVTENCNSGYGVGSRRKKRKEWSAKETIKFYRALHAAGTDFSLLTPLFPGRSRHDIKMKFKREERRNRMLIDRALTQPLKFDLTHLEELEEEEDLFEQLPPVDSTNKRKTYYKSSAAAREIDDKNENKRKRITTKPKINKQQSETYNKIRQGLDSLASSSEDEYIQPDTSTVINEKNPRPTRICRLNTSNYEKQLKSDNSDTDSDNDSSNEQNLSPNEDDHPDIERIKLENKKSQQKKTRQKQKSDINKITSNQNENIIEIKNQEDKNDTENISEIINQKNNNIQEEKIEINEKTKSDIKKEKIRPQIKPKINLYKFRTHKKVSEEKTVENIKEIIENEKQNNQKMTDTKIENLKTTENLEINVNKIKDQYSKLLGQKLDTIKIETDKNKVISEKNIENDCSIEFVSDKNVADIEKLTDINVPVFDKNVEKLIAKDVNMTDLCVADFEKNDDVETNIVIAHAENAEPDKILIDVVSRGAESDVQTKVSLKIEGSPSCNGLEPGSLVIMGAGSQFKVYMVTPDHRHVPVDLDSDLVRSLLDTNAT